MQHHAATSSSPAAAFNNCNDSNIANANLQVQEAPTKTTSGGIEATRSTASCWMEDLFQNSTAIIENNSLNFTGSKRNFHKKIKLVGELISSQQLSSYINLGKITITEIAAEVDKSDDYNVAMSKLLQIVRPSLSAKAVEGGLKKAPKRSKSTKKDLGDGKENNLPSGSSSNNRRAGGGRGIGELVDSEGDFNFGQAVNPFRPATDGADRGGGVLKRKANLFNSSEGDFNFGVAVNPFRTGTDGADLRRNSLEHRRLLLACVQACKTAAEQEKAQRLKARQIAAEEQAVGGSQFISDELLAELDLDNMTLKQREQLFHKVPTTDMLGEIGFTYQKMFGGGILYTGKVMQILPEACE